MTIIAGNIITSPQVGPPVFDTMKGVTSGNVRTNSKGTEIFSEKLLSQSEPIQSVNETNPISVTNPSMLARLSQPTSLGKMSERFMSEPFPSRQDLSMRILFGNHN